jgi:DNA (cytosine-5)-methyltransferase 1
LKFKNSLPPGYITECRVLNSADYGVPQARRRAIVIGSNILPPDSLFPTPDHYESTDSFDRQMWRDVRSSLNGVPRKPSFSSDDTWDRDEPKAGLSLHVARNPTNISLERYRAVPEGGNRFDLQRALPDLTPPCWIRKKTGGTDLFGRLWWDRPSVTIRTEFYKPEKGRYLHPSEDRPITIWEAAKLQTIPEDFYFFGSKTEVAKQIGNAVPPLFAERIAERIAHALDSFVPSSNSELTMAQIEA